MKKTLLLATAMLMVVCLGYAQNSFWKETSEPPSDERLSSGRIKPASYKIFALNIQQFKNELEQAPVRGVLTNSIDLIMAFPNPEGKLENFKVIEAAVLHPDLAAKYPGIKSFAGQGIDDPTSTIRFSISDQLGFHGMISSGKRWTYYIDPYSIDRTEYKVYGREELDAGLKDFICETENSIRQEDKKSSGSNARTNDRTLRRYRLALSCTAEYGNIFAGSGSNAQKIANILAQMNITMTRVNGIFERDLAITMQLVPNNDQIIYFGATNSDPWTNEWNNKTQQINDQIIGSANYDIGHNFNTTGGGNAGCIECVCINGSKGSGFTGRADPTGDPFDIDYVAHEMGHQYGGFHTQSSSLCISGDGTTEVEPGSGSTIMGYAGICTPNIQSNSDAYFHYVSIRDISANVQSGPSSSCPVTINLSNNPPTANAGSDYTIPKSTPFVLRGQGSDPDGDAITYTWEQNDPQTSGANTSTPSPTKVIGPMYRSIEGTTSPNRYMPRIQDVINNNLAPTWEVISSVGRTLNFALTVRDNRAGGGQTSDDLMRITVNGSAGPFTVTAPNSNVTWTVGQSQTVTWNVSGTNAAPVNCATVNILLSTDGGFTYPVTLLSGTPNDGTQSITVPNNVSSMCRVMVQAADNIFYDISNANFSIQGGVACNPTIPTGLAASGITTSSGVLNWNAVTAATYDVRYRVSGTSTWTTISSATNNTTLTSLAANTTYETQVRSNCSGSTSGYSSSVNFTTLPVSGGCTTTISSFPYTESFENGTVGAWVQSTADNIDWTVHVNATPSSNTGPSSGSAGGFYIYTEASTSGVGFPNKVAIITSPCFNLSGQTTATLTFDHHMYGADMGSLSVQASTNGTAWTSLWSDSGDNGNVWNTATVSLSAYVGGIVSLRFVGTTGSNYRSDMAIDNVRISTTSGGGGCSGGIASFPYTESFENNIGAWTQASGDDLDWTVDANGTPSSTTGPPSATDGTFYIYTEASNSGIGFPSKQAIINSPCFNLTGETSATVNFAYHMYGADMGSLSFQASTNGTTWTTLWSRSGNQGNSWQTATVDLSTYTGGNVSLRFLGVTGNDYRSDMALDDFELTTGAASGCTDVALTLTFDNYPEETSWAIRNSSGTTVASGGTYNSALDGSTRIETSCLDAGCYTLTVSDTYGDGMCCSFGNGSFSLSVGGTVVASGGSFGSSTTANFCVTSGAKESRGGEEQIVLQDQSFVSPNPVRDVLMVTIPNDVIVKSMNIVSMSGTTVKSVSPETRQINVSPMSNGLYVLFIQTDKSLIRHKFIKE